jgi:hypothetical protein
MKKLGGAHRHINTHTQTSRCYQKPPFNFFKIRKVRGKRETLFFPYWVYSLLPEWSVGWETQKSKCHWYNGRGKPTREVYGVGSNTRKSCSTGWHMRQELGCVLIKWMFRKMLEVCICRNKYRPYYFVSRCVSFDGSEKEASRTRVSQSTVFGNQWCLLWIITLVKHSFRIDNLWTFSSSSASSSLLMSW